MDPIHRAEIEAKNQGDAIKQFFKIVYSNDPLKASLLDWVSSDPFPQTVYITKLPDGKPETYLVRFSPDGKTIKDIKKPKDEKESKKQSDDMMSETFAEKLKEYW